MIYVYQDKNKHWGCSGANMPLCPLQIRRFFFFYFFGGNIFKTITNTFVLFKSILLLSDILIYLHYHCIDVEDCCMLFNQSCKKSKICYKWCTNLVFCWLAEPDACQYIFATILTVYQTLQYHTNAIYCISVKNMKLINKFCRIIYANFLTSSG